ncbi:hypothetical protein L0F63_001119, partial [Massospora cicadina]
TMRQVNPKSEPLRLSLPFSPKSPVRAVDPLNLNEIQRYRSWFKSLMIPDEELSDSSKEDLIQTTRQLEKSSQGDPSATG